MFGQDPQKTTAAKETLKPRPVEVQVRPEDTLHTLLLVVCCAIVAISLARFALSRTLPDFYINYKTKATAARIQMATTEIFRRRAWLSIVFYVLAFPLDALRLLWKAARGWGSTHRQTVKSSFD